MIHYECSCVHGYSADNCRLANDSPCINAGVNRDWMTDAVDLDSRHRLDPFSRIVDMGCFEYLPAGMLISVP